MGNRSVKVILLVCAVLCGCAQPVPRTLPSTQNNYIFDLAQYAKSQGWAGKPVKGPGIAYDVNGKAVVVR